MRVKILQNTFHGGQPKLRAGEFTDLDGDELKSGLRRGTVVEAKGENAEPAKPAKKDEKKADKDK